jgi:hypothetical protein
MCALVANFPEDAAVWRSAGTDADVTGPFDPPAASTTTAAGGGGTGPEPKTMREIAL